MAKVSNPLLSLDAAGSLGNAITFQGVRGCSVATRWHRPSGEPTSRQLTQRARVETAVSFWQTKLGRGQELEAWSRLASVRRQSGRQYSVAVGVIARALASTPRPSYATGLEPSYLANAMYHLAVPSDPGGPDEPGYLEVYAGPDPARLTRKGYIRSNRSPYITPRLGEDGETVYVACYRDGLPRSGMYKLTLAYTKTNLCPSPRFEDPSDWTLDPPLFISGGRLVFCVPPGGTYTAKCYPPIVTGRSYGTFVCCALRHGNNTARSYIGGSVAATWEFLGYSNKVVYGIGATGNFLLQVAANAAGDETECQEIAIFEV